MAKRFYNPGTAIDNRIQFDHPTNDIREQNIVSYWSFHAPAQSFFEIPTEIEVMTTEGSVRHVSVEFWKQIKTDYARYGVVLVDQKAKPRDALDNVVSTDKEAREKGDELWKESLFQLYREHERLCMEARSAGAKPRRAIGPTAYALKVLNIEDPAGDIADVVQKKEDVSKVASLEAQIAELQKVVMNLATKGK
jgi:hypothetical protein